MEITITVIILFLLYQIIPDQRRRLRESERVENLYHFLHALQYRWHVGRHSGWTHRQSVVPHGRRGRPQTVDSVYSEIHAPEFYG